MAHIPFNRLPDNGRLWIFAADREYSEAEARDISLDLTEFLTGWAAHGAQVDAAFELRYGRFILIGASDTAANPSGCSIDAMTRFVRSLGEKLGIDFMSAPMVYYRLGDKVTMTDRAEFRRLAKEAFVDSQTIVFNNTLTEVGPFRSGKWEVPARESWHFQAFSLN